MVLTKRISWDNLLLKMEVILIEKLNSRKKQIIRYLLQNINEYVTVNKISSFLNVSEKTIYRDLKIFEKSSFIVLDKIKGKGIKISKYNNQYLDVIYEDKILIPKFSTIQRRYNIYYDLLIMSPKSTSVYFLSEKYFVSHTSIVNDIKFIENNLLDKRLRIVKDYYGTRIEGSEQDIRSEIQKLISSYDNENELIKNMNGRLSEDTYNKLTEKFDKKYIEKVEKIISSVEDILLYRLGDVYYVNLCTHILIMIKRNKENLVKTEKNITDKIKDEYLYEISNDVIKKIENEFKIKIHNSEALNIYRYLISSGISKINENYKELVFEEDEFVDEFINKIIENTNLNIRSNKNIYSLFIIHMNAAINRIKFSISIKNPILEEIKNIYGEVYNMISTSVKELSKGNPLSNISESEISYIVMYFQIIYENTKKNKNIIIVCSSGFGTSQLLKNRLINKINNLNVVEVIPYIDIFKIDLTNIDFIVSTIKLENIIKPVINVSVLLNDSDVRVINDYLNGEINDSI